MREWLEGIRKDAGLTMKEIAQKLGISESYYCAIENGTRQKRMEVALVSGISAATGVPVTRVLELENEYETGRTEVKPSV